MGGIKVLINFLEQLTHLKPFSYFEEYRDDPNYEYEIYALNHSTQINGEVRILPNTPNDLIKWIMYIEQRALTSQNVILRAKYNDLIWIYKKLFDHSNLKLGNVNNKCALAIEYYIILIERDILSRKNDEELLQHLKNYLFRAWHLSKEIKSPLQSKLVQLMLEVENSIENDSRIGLWGFSFKKLIKDSTISLDDDQVNRIINRIKLRVDHLDGKEYHPLEYAIKLLLEYYKDNCTEQEKYLSLLIKNAHIKSERPFENQNRFKEIIKLCKKYQFKELKEEATISYQKYGADVTKQMARFEHKFEVIHEQFQELINSLSDVDCRIHFFKVTKFFISSRCRAEENYDNRSKSFFFRDLFSTALVNEEGVTTKTLTSKEDTLYHENKLSWQIQLVFFDAVLKNSSLLINLPPKILQNYYMMKYYIKIINRH